MCCIVANLAYRGCSRVPAPIYGLVTASVAEVAELVVPRFSVVRHVSRAREGLPAIQPAVHEM